MAPFYIKNKHKRPNYLKYFLLVQTKNFKKLSKFRDIFAYSSILDRNLRVGFHPTF